MHQQHTNRAVEIYRTIRIRHQRSCKQRNLPFYTKVRVGTRQGHSEHDAALEGFDDHGRLLYIQSLEPEVRTATNSVYAELGRTGTGGPVPDPPATDTTGSDTQHGVVHQQRSATMDQKKIVEGEETKKVPTRGKLLQFAGKMRANHLGGAKLNA